MSACRNVAYRVRVITRRRSPLPEKPPCHREGGNIGQQRFADLVLNNQILSSLPGRVSCRRAVRVILRRGDTLRVWEPGKDEPTIIHGVDQPR
ncbi:DddA-like double-stranded DNA deaminase toxin [Saccharopolyspora phatthalungensis]|uniref:DddA-like double-stranded DNA deaminase toxin n=1 Tax=Saccharopolyspora phatthalungensis TaxID=664693 RepID=UPI0035E4459B